MTDEQHVFGYGALLDYDYFGVGDPAVLDGWRLAFNGYATLTRCDDEQAYGAVLTVTREQLAAFDRMEGYRPGRAGNYYDRQRVTVTGLGTGAKVEAWVYVQLPQTFKMGVHVQYLWDMQRGYEFYELPLEKLEEAVVRMQAWAS